MILKRVSIYLPVDDFDVYSEFYQRKCSFHVAACAPKLSVRFSVLISVLSHSTKRVPFGSATFDEMHKAQKCPKMCLQSLKLFIQVLLLT